MTKCKECGKSLTKLNWYRNEGDYRCKSCISEYQKKYYRENRERVKERVNKYREDNIEVCRKRDRVRSKDPDRIKKAVTYQREHPEKKALYNSIWYYEHGGKEISSKIAQRRQKEKKRLRIKYFNNRCFICGAKDFKLDFHKIDGEKHSRDILVALDHGNNIKDFCLLCSRCHSGAHFCYDRLGMTWKQILRRMRDGRG
jgi:hypothetical protein